MKSESFTVIQGWMCNELNLKGNDLLVYALIYGITQDGETEFYGSRHYISETFNISLPTVDKALKNLVELGYITKREEIINGVKLNRYKASLGVVKNLYGGGKETLHNNIDNKIDNKVLLSKDNNKEFLGSATQKPKKKNKSLYEKCLDEIILFTQDTELAKLLTDYLVMRLSVRDKPIRGVNQWKGMLNKLADIVSDFPGTDYSDVVKQSLENGWLNFYEVHKSTKRKSIKNDVGEHNVVTKSRNDNIDDVIERRKRDGKEVYF